LPGNVRALRRQDPQQRDRRTAQPRQRWRRVRPDRRGRGRWATTGRVTPRLTLPAQILQVKRYPGVIRLWDNAWAEFIPFLDYDVEIRTVICSTNAIESLNARYRRAIKASGRFANELAALKCLYLVTRSLDPTGQGRARWVMRWKPALNAFAITFADRFPVAETY
jgi:transposase-like protein